MRAVPAAYVLLFGGVGVKSFLTAAPPTSSHHATRISSTRISATATSSNLETLKFLTPETAEAVRTSTGTPAYVYDLATLQSNARSCLAFPNAYGLKVRYAMKSLPNAAILQVLCSMGVCIDASSGWEVKRAIAAGVQAEDISLSSQELPTDFAELLDLGIDVNACSLSQLDSIGAACPGREIGIRFNPGLGSGGTGKTNVGGPSSSFGLWYEFLPEVKEIIAKHDLKVTRVHTHIGSGSDPAVWQKVSGMSLDLCRELPDVTTLNLGGGYKVGRMNGEVSTDLQTVGTPVKKAFEDFAADTGRELKLEIEPGTYLVANVGALVATVQDKVSTGKKGHTFLKLDAGMTDLLRPALYGSLHPIITLPSSPTEETEKCVVVGHCCESGDLLTPVSGKPDDIAERELAACEIGDLCVVEGCGAYVSGMNAKNYNSFPEAPELVLDEEGALHIIRRRQQLDQITQNEVPRLLSVEQPKPAGLHSGRKSRS